MSLSQCRQCETWCKSEFCCEECEEEHEKRDVPL